MTEEKFKELYEQAARLRAMGASAAARGLLSFLFDQGRDVGGYGVVRLSFVLRDLAELAGLDRTDGTPRGPEEQQALDDLKKRRDEREGAVRQGLASFVDLQELVALNRYLGEPQRSFDLHDKLQELMRTRPELAETRKAMGGLLLEEILPRDAEKIADQILHEKLKRWILELSQHLRDMLTRNQLNDPQLARLVRDIRAEGDRYRNREALPRDEMRRQATMLARDTADLLSRHRMADGTPVGGREQVESLLRDLSQLIQRSEIRPDLLQDQELRDRVVKLARDVAGQISDYRIDEDFGEGDAKLPPALQQGLTAKIERNGLLAYEVLLRIGDEALAERVGSWLLAFRQDTETYASLAGAARRSRKPAVETRLQEEAQRLLIR
ncbi:MAG TPA: hypothetical protein VJ885_18980 [Thermoanaerobaculia bacterium]|nr:hypothetical protein [Thermoanaerobaculia bacterium]